MNKNLHFEVLPSEQKRLLELFSQRDFISSFYLAGGTALALLIGHRQSIDLDFFTKINFDNQDIINFVRNLGKFELFDEAQNTINGSFNNVKISFLKYEYPLLKEPHKFFFLSIADIFDIAIMKLSAISSRGSKKDFVDLYFLLQYFSLAELFDGYKAKYGTELSNFYHLQKSLVYFEDAESQPMPKMMKGSDWAEIKRKIILEVKRVGV